MRSREGIGWWIALLLLIPIYAGNCLSLKDIRKHYYGDQDAEISEEYRALQNDIRRELAGLDPQLLKHFYVDSEECDEVNCLGHSVEDDDEDESEASEDVSERLTKRPLPKNSTSKTKRGEEETVTSTDRPRTTTTTTQEPTTTLKTTTTSTTQVPTTTPTTSTTLPSTTRPTTTTTTSTTTTTTTTTTTPKPTTTTTIKTTTKPSTTRMTTTTTTTQRPTTTTTTKRPTTTTTTKPPTTTATSTEFIPPNTTVHFTTTEPFQFFVAQSSEEQPVITPATPAPKLIPIVSPSVLSLSKSAAKSNEVLARIYHKLHKLKLLKHHRQKADANRKKSGGSRGSKASLDQTALLNRLALDEKQFATVGEIVVKFPAHQAQKTASRKPRHQPNPSRSRLRRQGSGAKRMKEEKKKARQLKKQLKEAQRKLKKESKKRKRELNRG